MLLEKQENLLENQFLRDLLFQENLQIVHLKTLWNVKSILSKGIQQEDQQSKEEIENSKLYYL